MRVTDIPTLLKLLLILLISQIPFYMVFSQSSENKKDNKISVKLIKTVNGKTEVIDTVLVADDYAKALRGIKGFKADTTLLKRLNKSYRSIQKVDSILARPGMKATIDNWKIRTKSDTAMFRKFNDRDVQIYQLEKHLDAAGIKQLKQLRSAKRDTLGMMRFKDRQIFVLGDDSSRHRIISRNFVFKDGDTIRFEKLMPGKNFRFFNDSLQVFRRDKNGSYSRSFKVTDGREIIIETDSIVVKHLGNGQVKERHVYIIKNNGTGNIMPLDTLKMLKKDNATSRMIRSEVTKVPDTDRGKLESAGNKIESKKKETLEIENINFYPNPNIGRFKLAFNLDQKGDVSIRILNSTGQVIYTEVVKDFSGSYNQEIDISGAGKGIYYLQVLQGKRSATRKIVIQ